MPNAFNCVKCGARLKINSTDHMCMKCWSEDEENEENLREVVKMLSTGEISAQEIAYRTTVRMCMIKELMQMFGITAYANDRIFNRTFTNYIKKEDVIAYIDKHNNSELASIYCMTHDNATWVLRMYNLENYRVMKRKRIQAAERKKMLERNRKMREANGLQKNAPSTLVKNKHCRNCAFGWGNGYCDYIGHTGKRRPTPIAECKGYKRKDLDENGKIKNDI